jgi:hypothetical protein
MAGTAVPLIYDPPIDGDMGPWLKLRAAQLLGSALGDPRNMGWIFDDMAEAGVNANVPAGWISSGSGSAASVMTAITDEGGGVSEVQTGATAGSAVTHASSSPLIANVTTAPWYAAYRFKVTTAVSGTQTKMFASLRNAAGNKTIGAGVYGPIGGAAATKFVFQYDGNEAGSVVDTGIVFDTAYHIYEMWGIGSTTLFTAMDLIPLASVVMAAAPTDSMQGYRGGNNGADNLARTSRTDWFGCYFKRS